jgi:hypothetical protein
VTGGTLAGEGAGRETKVVGVEMEGVGAGEVLVEGVGVGVELREHFQSPLPGGERVRVRGSAK